MSWGEGYIYGIGVAFLVWLFLIRPVDKRYYKKKMELLQRRIKNKENQNSTNGASGNDARKNNPPKT